MSLFGWVLIRKEDLKAYERSASVQGAAVQCHRWFAGWKDLDIIWDYLFSETYFGGISEARAKYAKARGTDEYGSPAPSPGGEGESGEG